MTEAGQAGGGGTHVAPSPLVLSGLSPLQPGARDTSPAAGEQPAQPGCEDSISVSADLAHGAQIQAIPGCSLTTPPLGTPSAPGPPWLSPKAQLGWGANLTCHWQAL